jgi:phage shock protein PspC (stress-responsive transcriptional regulator)
MENPRDEREAPQAAGSPPPGFEPPPAATSPGASEAPAGGTVPPQGGYEWPTLGQRAAYDDEADAGYYGAPGGAYTGHGGGYHAAPNPPDRVPAGRYSKRLYRSETDRMLAGVCGGLSDFLGIDANLLRIVFALLAIFAGGSGLLIYVVMWAIVPRKSRLGISPTESAMDAVNEVRERFSGVRRA